MPEVKYTDLDGKEKTKTFLNESDAKIFRDGYLKENKIKGKWEW